MAENPIRGRRHRQRSAGAAGLFPLRSTGRFAKGPVSAGGLTKTVTAGRFRGVLRVLIQPGPQRRILLLETINPLLETTDNRLKLCPDGLVLFHQVSDRAKQLA